MQATSNNMNLTVQHLQQKPEKQNDRPEEEQHLPTVFHWEFLLRLVRSGRFLLFHFSDMRRPLKDRVHVPECQVGATCSAVPYGPVPSASLSGWVLVWFLCLSLDPSVDTTTTTGLTQDRRVRRHSCWFPGTASRHGNTAKQHLWTLQPMFL